MRRAVAIETAVAVLLLFFVAVYASRLVHRVVGLELALGNRTSSGLRATTRSTLAGLEGRVSLTYFVSGRRTMPSHMQGTEDAVRSLLGRIRSAAPERVDVRVIDPELDPGGPSYAARMRVSPVKVRKVLRDESSEQAVWSSLAIAHGRYPEAVIQGITMDDLPYLEDLVVQHLRAGPESVQAVIAVASPEEGYTGVRELISQASGTRVVRADFDREAEIPPEADVLLWIEPRAASSEHAAELRRFLRAGRTAIVAGSTYSVEYLPRAAGHTAYRIVPSRCDWEALLRPFGLALDPVLVLDENHGPISWNSPYGGTQVVDAPFHLRILPSAIDTKTLQGAHTGVLLVDAVSPIRVDPRALSATGRQAAVVATTSEYARVIDLPDAEFDDASLLGARAVPKQPWLLHLSPADRWQGDLLLAGSPGLFRDGTLDRPGNANAAFMKMLLRTFTDPLRLALVRVPRHEPPRIPSLSLAARVAWRALVVLLVPAAVMALALRRPRTQSPPPLFVPWLKPALLGATAFAAVLVLARAWRSGPDVRADLTEGKSHTVSAITGRLLEGCRDRLDVELLLSDTLHMPASLKGLEGRIRRTLRSLGVEPRIVRPEDLPASERARLEGVEPFDVETVENDLPVTSRVWGALRLKLEGRVEVVPRLDARTAAHLEFLVAAAVRRLQRERAPLVGVLSDLPRLTPAEALEDYQRQGYTAPVGADAYSLARQMLARYGYETAYINPDDPVFPPGMDVLVWLQPRYPWKTYSQFAAFLEGGGRAVLALQHYNVQQRQYPGSGFETVYWPQPQFHDFNRFLELLGVRQVGEKTARKGGEEPGEVLFDRQHADLVLETQVSRRAQREREGQQVARPFLIRAAGQGLSRASVVTSRLGALLFVWGSRFVFDGPVAKPPTLRREVLVTTSPRSWTFPWKGGWIPEGSFREPAKLLGPQPLAVLLEGRFPAVEIRKDETSGRDRPVLAPDRPAGKAGKLLLIGSSEMFKNTSLHLAGYDHDQFLLNAVAYLAWGADLAEIQARVRAPRALTYQPASVRAGWRAFTLGLPPVLFLVYGVVHRRLRRRPLVHPPDQP